MKKILKRLVILFLVFAGCVIFFSFRMNYQETVETVSAKGSTLPVIYMNYDDTQANPLTGYLTSMDESTMRESLTPIGSDRSLQIQVKTYDQDIADISYAVTDLVTDTLVENGLVGGITEKEGTLIGTITLGKPILMQQEYGLCLTVNRTSGAPIYYYTRIVQTGSTEVKNYLDFAVNFYQTALNKDRMNDIMSYLESDSTASNNTFHSVNIKSSLDQVSWGTLEPTLVIKGIPVIKELNDNTCSMTIDYVISTKNSDGDTEYYDVRDFYRVKPSTNRMILLSFERETNEIFNANLPVSQDNGVNLGVADKNVTFETNAGGDIVVFVVNGDLWSYNQSIGRAVRVFSFRNATTLDERTENVQHDIAINRVSENGSAEFTVYGYFSAGEHEGLTGIAVYAFDAEQNTLQEKMFLPLSQTYQNMQLNIGKTVYAGENNLLYLYLGTQLCSVNINSGAYSVVQDEIRTEGYVASESGRSVAWTDGNDIAPAQTATMMDLETKTQTQITAADGEKVRLLGFFNEDIVYGLVRDSDILTDEAGSIMAGMYRICISTIDGTIVKDYQREGTYIIGARTLDGYLELDLGTKGTGTYHAAGEEHIMNTAAEENHAVVSSITTSRKQQQIVLEFANPQKVSKLSVMYAEFLENEVAAQETIIEWPAQDTGVKYYVYGYGELISIESQANTAIAAANDVGGVVLNEHQQYVWERANWPEEYQIPVEDLPQQILSLPLDSQALADALGDSYTVLNLSGCEKEDMYYMISRGYPVFGKTANGACVLMVGYDEFNIWVYNPESDNQIMAIGTNDSREMFEAQGNIFLSYTHQSESSD